MLILLDKDNISVSTSSNKIPHIIDGIFLSKLLKIIKTILPKYTVCINFVGLKKIRQLNKDFRNKDYSTDILSFNVDDDIAEIYICLPKAKVKANMFKTDYINYLHYLLIHGSIHITGLDHGDEMDTLEKKYCKKLLVSYIY